MLFRKYLRFWNILEVRSRLDIFPKIITVSYKGGTITTRFKYNERAAILLKAEYS